MAVLKLKELSNKQDLLTGGHRMCAGCGAPIVVRQILLAIDEPVVVANATGCLEVATTIFPFTAWKVPFIHSAFENAAATISGVEAMYQSLKKQGKYPAGKKVKFIAFGGDGGTYDIGLQSLSGALERGHDFMYICYDNGAYMNTGIQRSSATPFGADTTTCPAGSVVQGKPQNRKDLTKIVMAHNIPYAAQASPHNWKDLMGKVQKAMAIEGPKFMNIIAPCNRGWRTQTNDAIALSKLAVNTNFWPLFEVEYGKTTINYQPKKNRTPIVQWLKPQGRFKHLFKPENEWMLAKFQEYVDDNWRSVVKMHNDSNPGNQIDPEEGKTW
ncbi:MAG TPA: thiamine pyrophosphate-dependent enzyme [Nitrospirota bacterium]|jgi:pyruvate ferredoxin oxidoreductase beta subunit